MNHCLSLIIGWLLDFFIGDPEKLPHPVVYMGKWIAMGEHRLNKGNHRKAKGAIFSILSIVILFTLLSLFFPLPLTTICQSIYQLPPLGRVGVGSQLPSFGRVGVGSLLVFYCLAGHTLRKEVRMVFEAVDRSIEEGRKQVGRIVGRDTSDLDAQEIRTAALETLAENLSDGVIAPLFWFLFLGIPGMLTYKLVNTFDSMIGYQNERYKDFGCWAAHIDDIANYIPARLTAILMVLVASLRHPTKIIHYSLFTIHFSAEHASPNSGWPESALAGILDCRFGGPHNYFGEYFYKPYIGTNPRPLTTKDMHTSLNICLAAECLAVAIVMVILL